MRGGISARINGGRWGRERGDAMSQFRAGHFVWRRRNGAVVRRFRAFVHTCPGEGCAIENYLQAKVSSGIESEGVVELGHTGSADYGSDAANSEGDSESAFAPTGEPYSTRH